jgi:hypothetical protein
MSVSWPQCSQKERRGSAAGGHELFEAPMVRPSMATIIGRAKREDAERHQADDELLGSMPASCHAGPRVDCFSTCR